MVDDSKPLSELVAQGWEILNYGATDSGGVKIDNFLLRKQKKHLNLTVRPKMVGKGYVIKELDI